MSYPTTCEHCKVTLHTRKMDKFHRCKGRIEAEATKEKPAEMTAGEAAEHFNKRFAPGARLLMDGDVQVELMYEAFVNREGKAQAEVMESNGQRWRCELTCLTPLER